MAIKINLILNLTEAFDSDSDEAVGTLKENGGTLKESHCFIISTLANGGPI